MNVLLASFDPVPAAKGASAHIRRNLQILRGAGHHVSLVSLGGPPLPGIRHLVLDPPGANWLQRARAFSKQLEPVLERGWDVVHVRSPFEGLAVPPDIPIVYEVNALYSIELPSRYPALINHPGFRDRMRAAELLLLERAAAVITPSAVTAQYLEDLGVRDVTIVPNAPSIPRLSRGYTSGDPAKLVYIGTLSSWQGLHQAVRCLSRLTHLDWTLDVYTHSKDRWLRKALRKAGLEERTTLNPTLDSQGLAEVLHGADIGLAPLTPGERNLVQGCMPVKLLDYMRAGLNVIAPDLQVVTDVLGEAPTYGAWSRTKMTALLEDRITGNRQALGEQMRARVEERFSESVQSDALLGVYPSLSV